jgi:hypothetical protein
VWGGEVGPDEITTGLHDFTPSSGFRNPRHAERYHDAALAEGYESELVYFSDGGAVVRVREVGSADPRFVSES